MATQDNLRITKDTSARKNTNIPSDLEAQAKEKYYKAIIDGLQDQYDAQMENQKTAHAEEIAKLKSQHANEIQLVKNAGKGAIEKVRKDCATKVTQLDGDIMDWERKYKELQQMFKVNADEKEAMAKEAEKNAAGEANQLRIQKLGLEKKITKLERKAAVDISFTGKGYKTRRYLRRHNEPFRDVIHDLK